MLLVLSEEHKEHLSFLTKVDIEVVREFCKISIEFIRKGANRRVYQAAAQKLNVDVTTVLHGVEGLIYLMTECSKLMVNDLDFQDSIIVLGFSVELNKELLSLYTQHCKEIRAILSNMAMGLPEYHDMEWRFDVQLASRSILQQADPQLLLRLHVKDGEKASVHVLQTDPVNLAHMTSVLESALAEIKTQHCRRILRNIK